jgi:histone H3/H4
MIDENKYSKLTPSAKAELERISEEFAETIFERAYFIANERAFASRDIIARYP